VVNVPGTNGQHNQVVTATGSTVLVRAGTGCSGSSSLLTFNPATHAEHRLVKAQHKQFGVEIVIPFYARANEPVFG